MHMMLIFGIHFVYFCCVFSTKLKLIRRKRTFTRNENCNGFLWNWGNWMTTLFLFSSEMIFLSRTLLIFSAVDKRWWTHFYKKNVFAFPICCVGGKLVCRRITKIVEYFSLTLCCQLHRQGYKIIFTFPNSYDLFISVFS